MSFIDIAKSAIERGFSVIPLNPRAKEPRFGWGAAHSTRELSRIDGCAPDCNIGICADENFLILETDDEAQLRQIIRNCTGKELPITLTSQARHGRPHFFFRQTARTREVGNSSVPGLFELRAKNQYVVGPGSVHPSGAVYHITADYEVLDMPDWLVDALLYLKGSAATVPVGQRVLEHVRDRLTGGARLGEGEGRHYLLTSWAGRLWDGRKTYEELFGEVWQINEQSCDPPRTQEHVADIVRWVMANGTPHDPGPKVVLGSQEVWGRTASSLEKRDIPARQALLTQGVDGPVVFYESSLNQVFSFRGLGKTNFSLGLAGCLVNGGDFLLFHSPHPQNVLYVDGELPISQLKERIGRQVGWKPNFWYVNGEDLPKTRIPSLATSNGEAQTKLVEAIEAHDIKVLMLDSLSTLFRFETNDEREWIEVEDFFKLLRQKYRLCVITLHHAGKAGLQRGHSRGDDLLDVSIKLDKFPDWEPGQELAFQLSYEKVRHGGRLDPFDATMKDGVWEVNPETDCIIEARDMIAAGKGRVLIQKKTGLSESKVRKLVKEYKATGQIRLNENANKAKKEKQ